MVYKVQVVYVLFCTLFYQVFHTPQNEVIHYAIMTGMCTHRDPKIHFSQGGDTPADSLTKVCFTHSVLPPKFSVLCMDNHTTPALYFAWPKLKCVCHSWLTLLLPQQKFAPSPLSQRGGEPSAATGLSPAEDSEENGHKELAQNVYTTYSYSRCVVCVCVCVSMWMHMYEVYTSACKQCWLDA